MDDYGDGDDNGGWRWCLMMNYDRWWWWFIKYDDDNDDYAGWWW